MTFAGIPDRASYVDFVFGSRGILAGAWANYRPRAGQVALAHAVDKALSQRTHLLAEGPTGTGKSLAYCVPASYHASTDSKTIVIVTANIALQEQLVSKDLPLLAKLLPWPFTFQLAKGRNNYLCVSKYYDNEVSRQRGLFDSKATAGKRHLDIVQAWAEEQIEVGVEGGATGDVSTLSIEPSPEVWREFSVAPDECKRSKCRFAQECFALEATERMRRANIVVTNYHLFMADLAVYAETNVDKVLPPFDVAILDEAHKAAEVARDFFGFQVTNEAARRAVRHLKRDAGATNRPDDLALAEKVEKASTQVFYTLSAIKRNKERYTSRLRYPLIGESHAIDPHTNRVETETVGELLNALEILIRVLAERVGITHGDQQAQWENDLTAATKLYSKFKNAFTLDQDGDCVYFIEEEGDERGGARMKISLKAKLVTVSQVLEQVLFGHRRNTEDKTTKMVIEGPQTAVVCTSATLAADNSFDFIAKELGAETYDSLIAQSPFNWKEQMLFIVPEGMPDPNDEKFADGVSSRFNEVVDMAHGRTLGLFTSRRVMNIVHDKLIGRGFRVLKQGDAPRGKLIEEFTQDVSSVLLGLESFWAGVDVPGESLSVVIIDRLPFPTPDDPVLDVISKKDKNWFFNYSVPRSIIQVKQGAGRLVRALDDRGVVVCFDNRLLKKNYGKQFLRSLPPCPKSTSLADIPEWLAGKVPPPEPIVDVDPFEDLDVPTPEVPSRGSAAESNPAPVAAHGLSRAAEPSTPDPFEGIDDEDDVERAAIRDEKYARVRDAFDGLVFEAPSPIPLVMLNAKNEGSAGPIRVMHEMMKEQFEQFKPSKWETIRNTRTAPEPENHYPAPPVGTYVDPFGDTDDEIASYPPKGAPPDPFEDLDDDEIPF